MEGKEGILEDLARRSMLVGAVAGDNIPAVGGSLLYRCSSHRSTATSIRGSFIYRLL